MGSLESIREARVEDHLTRPSIGKLCRHNDAIVVRRGERKLPRVSSGSVVFSTTNVYSANLKTLAGNRHDMNRSIPKTNPEKKSISRCYEL